jgi:hypothetical protein
MFNFYHKILVNRNPDIKAIAIDVFASFFAKNDNPPTATPPTIEQIPLKILLFLLSIGILLFSFYNSSIRFFLRSDSSSEAFTCPETNS